MFFLETDNICSAIPPASSGVALKLNGFEAAAQMLTAAFDAKSVGKLFRSPLEDRNLPDAKVFIVSWVDYCNKYGMGYALTDGSVGVHFNDSTTLVLSADKEFVFIYIFMNPCNLLFFSDTSIPFLHVAKVLYMSAKIIQWPSTRRS